MFFSPDDVKTWSCSVTCHAGTAAGRGVAAPVLDTGARMGCVVNDTPRPIYPQERDPVLILQKVGWCPGPVWTCTENLDPTRGVNPGTSSPYQVDVPNELSRPPWRGMKLTSLQLCYGSTKLMSSSPWRQGDSLRVTDMRTLNRTDRL